MPKVLNKQTDPIPPGAVYVGRPSKWGNPYKVGPYTRERAVALYRELIERALADPEDPFDAKVKLEELRGKDLVCWCAPLPCHADILLELANKEKP